MVADAKQQRWRESTTAFTRPEVLWLPFLGDVEGMSALLVQGYEGRARNRVFLFSPSSLLQPAVCSKPSQSLIARAMPSARELHLQFPH